MGRHIDLAAETMSLQVPAGMEGRVSGQWGKVVCDMICRDCVAVQTYIEENDAVAHSDLSSNPFAKSTAPKINAETRTKVNQMSATEYGVLSGRECMSPTKRFGIVGKEACHAIFFTNEA